MIGMSNPEEGDEAVGGRAAYAPSEYGGPLLGDTADKPAMNAEQTEAPDELDALLEESGGYVRISDDIAAVIERAADSVTDFESFREELEKLVKNWPADKIAECIAVATFKARALGDAEFDKEYR